MDNTIKNYTDEQLSEAYDKLPDDLQNEVLSENTEKIIETIVKQNNLSEDKIIGLADETVYVMLSLTHPKEYIFNLSKRLGIDMATARKIAEEVNSQIFSKVRESLKKIHGIASDSPIAPPTSSVASPTPIPVPVPPEEKISPFEAKTKQEIFRAAPEESKQVDKIEVTNPTINGYSGGKDPYREPID
jgi:hypothetical protein